jgi:hypothetical protein
MCFPIFVTAKRAKEIHAKDAKSFNYPNALRNLCASAPLRLIKKRLPFEIPSETTLNHLTNQLRFIHPCHCCLLRNDTRF